MRPQFYNGNQNLKGAGVQINWEPWQIDEWIKCKMDPIYFIKKYIKIVTVDHGLQPMSTYGFQEDFANAILSKSNRVIGLCARQMGKSTIMAAIICHYIIFNDNKTCAILANKAITAREILGRVQMAYEHLPKWLQHGVVEWNKGSFVIENG
jgi:phage terminase large subunit-like protein